MSGVSSDDYIESGEPGENAQYMVKVTNDGNVNDTYHLSVLRPTGLEDAKDWARIAGLAPGDLVTIPIGETKAISMR